MPQGRPRRAPFLPRPPPGAMRVTAWATTLNFTLIWRHFDKLWGGLLLSLELARVSIVIGIVIGLALAVAPRLRRAGSRAR